MRSVLHVVVLPLVLAGCKPPSWFDINNATTPIDESSSSGSLDGESSGSSSGDSSDAAGSDSVGMSTGSTDADTTGTSEADATSTTEPATTGPVEACGDGVIQDGEECDDGGLEPDDGCNEYCFKDRVVFTTSLEFPGDLNGIKGAIGYCRTLAAQGDIPRDETFEPWLSDSKTDAIDHVHRGKGRYLRPDGVVVANSFDDFLAGMLLAPLDIDEHGNPIGEGQQVWTGTRLDGTKMPDKSHCNDWFGVEDPFALEAWAGNASETGMYWTIDDDPITGPQPCSVKFRLYCFEGK